MFSVNDVDHRLREVAKQFDEKASKKQPVLDHDGAMSGNDVASLTFYPAYCFSSSPTYGVWVKLTITSIFNLQSKPGYEGQNLYFHLNHPIQWIQTMGVIVAFGECDKSYLWFFIDDGSGTVLRVSMPRLVRKPSSQANAMEVIRIEPDRLLGRSEVGNLVDFTSLKVGNRVKVKGSLRTFRGSYHLSLERLSLLQDPMSETKFWAEAIAFHDTVLSSAWELSIAQRLECKEKESRASKLTEEKMHKKLKREARSKAREVKDKQREILNQE